tara:strand:- start:21 stop:434 length:414 start_codon:yes stop_codon:yes gene_type:complete
MAVQIPIAVFLAGQMGKELIKRVGRKAAEKIAKNPKKRADFVKAREKEQTAKSRKKIDTMRKAQKDAMKEDKPASPYSGITRNTGGAGKGDKPLKAVDEMLKKQRSRMMGGGKVMKYSMGGKIDGVALRGKTRGRNR